MLSYTVIVSNEAVGDLDEIADHIAREFKSTSGHNFVNRILGQIQALSYSASTHRESPYMMANLIHPHAKKMNIINHSCGRDYQEQPPLKRWCFTSKVNT